MTSVIISRDRYSSVYSTPLYLQIFRLDFNLSFDSNFLSSPVNVATAMNTTFSTSLDCSWFMGSSRSAFWAAFNTTSYIACVEYTVKNNNSKRLWLEKSSIETDQDGWSSWFDKRIRNVVTLLKDSNLTQAERKNSLENNPTNDP